MTSLVVSPAVSRSETNTLLFQCGRRWWRKLCIKFTGLARFFCDSSQTGETLHSVELLFILQYKKWKDREGGGGWMGNLIMNRTELYFKSILGPYADGIGEKYK